MSKIVKTPGDYTLSLTQTKQHPNEMAIVNTDQSINLFNLDTMSISQTFNQEKRHKAKINVLKYSKVHDNEKLSNILFTAAEDKMVKLWDRRTGNIVSELGYQNSPFYSLDVNQNTITAGTNSEIIFWDLRKLKVAGTYQCSHSDDVTALAYHPTNPSWLISCATDNLLCHFNFADKPSTSEDDTLEGVYASEQPMIDCGFIRDQYIWAQTSINSVEVITVENQDIMSKVTSFPHHVEYVIGCSVE